MDQSVRILVVVDEPHTREAALRLLKQADYKVWAAATAGRAWQVATEKMPDLILLAAALPDEERTSLCRRLMAEPSLANSVVALLSDEETMPEGQAKNREVGADECIDPPASDSELLAHVQALVHVKQMQDELRLRAQELRILRPEDTISQSQKLAETKPDRQGQALGVAGAAQDIAERKHMVDALHNQKAQLEHLWQINLRLSAELDLHDLLQAITQNAIELLGGTAGGFYLHRPDLDLLEWVVDIDADILPLGTMVCRGEGLSGQVWEVDEPLLADGHRQEAGQHGPANAHPWGGVVAVPIHYGREADEGEFFGVLQVMVEEPRSFSREDAELLRLFANHAAAAAIRNARLYELARREIAERKQAQEQLRQERDLVSRIMESSPLGIVVLDRQGRIVYANPQVSRIWGRGLESLLLHRYDDPRWHIVSEDVSPQSAERQLFTRAISGGERVVGEQLTIEAEGDRKWSFSVSVIPLTDESGEISRLVALVEDITTRLQAEKALRESESRYRRLVETSPDAITLTDPEGSILTCNQQAATLHGFESREAMIGINVLDLFPPEELTRARASLQKALVQGNVRALECRLLRKDGSRFPAELSASALYDEEGKPQAVVSVVRDITQHVQSQAALRESEERLRSTLSSLEDLVFVLDKDSRFVDYHQPAAAGELYLEPAEFLGRTVRETMPLGVVEPFQKAFDAVVATHEVQQFDYVLTLAGKQQWYSAKVSARFDREGAFDGATIVSRNITERKQAVEALERRNRILETLNKLSEVAWSTPELDPLLNTVVQMAVQAIDATSGCICGWQEGTGTTTRLAEYCAPEACDAERISSLGVEHRRKGDRDPGDWLYSADAYQVVHAHAEHAHDAQTDAKYQAFMDRLGVKSMLHVPLRIRGKPSGYIELRESRQVRSFAPREVELVLALARQLSIGMENAHLYEQTQRELVERRQAQERLQASLQEKEVLLKEIHHRVKNNLQVISSLLDMQLLSIQSPEAGEALEDSQHRVRAMAFVHERLYQSEDLASVDVREYLEGLAGYLLAAYERSTDRIHLNLQVEDVYLDLDTAIASGLIVNELVSNALKHAFPPTREGDGEIGIRLAALDDGWFELQVRDNGVGLPPDLVTVGAQSLGLRLVNMLTQQLQGTLDVKRSAGTAFTITFPGIVRDPGEKAGHG